MLWILIEALLALALVVGVILWIAVPIKKRRDIPKDTAPVKPYIEERERRKDGL